MFWQQLSVIGELRTLLVWNLVVSEAVYLWWSKRKTHKMIETHYHHYQPVNYHCWLEAFLLECQDEWTWPASIHQLPATATMTNIFWVERRHKNHLINSNKLSRYHIMVIYHEAQKNAHERRTNLKTFYIKSPPLHCKQKPNLKLSFHLPVCPSVQILGCSYEGISPNI